MNEGISVIILISHKIDVWHSKLHARFVFGTNWEDINNAVDYLKACEMINKISKLDISRSKTEVWIILFTICGKKE